MPTITFIIRKGGEVTEQVEGAVGNECERLTRPIEEALGGQVTRDYSPEYYQTLTDEQTLGGAYGE